MFQNSIFTNNLAQSLITVDGFGALVSFDGCTIAQNQLANNSDITVTGTLVRSSMQGQFDFKNCIFAQNVGTLLALSSTYAHFDGVIVQGNTMGNKRDGDSDSGISLYNSLDLIYSVLYV